MNRYAVVPLLALALGAHAARAQVALVSHPSRPVRTISLDDLRRLYLGQTTRVAGQRVTLVETTPVRAAFYRAVTQMSEAQVDRAWLAVVFQGGDAAPPRKFATADDARRYVAEHPDAIGFLPADAVDNTVTVVPINNLTPRQPGYPIP